MVPSKEAITDGSRLMNPDGCLNFFAGPQNKDFFAEVNFYDIHYSFMHYVGTSGGNTEDMRKAVQLIEEKKVRAANVVTHILGLDAVAETTLNQPTIGGGKKLIYTHKAMERTNLSELSENSDLRKILDKTDGIWSKEAEEYILTTQPEI
jgi:threonine dehydrogenase-like Zn-dependent dehydrogenase